MRSYEDKAFKELKIWQKNMQRKPSNTGSLSKCLQDKINSIIPDKAHNIIAEAI